MRNCRFLFVLLAGLCAARLAYAQQTISCNSYDGKKHYCPADTHAGVRMVKQRSGSPCTQGVSWDYDDRGIWVDKGCRADFQLTGNAAPTSVGGQRAASRTITCSSSDGKRKYCETDTSNARITMSRQISSSACVEGTTWGFDSRGIWVDKGCRADFRIETGGEHGGVGATSEDSGRTCREAVGSQRANQLVKQCLQVSPATHPPCNAQNTCKLITDEIKRSCQLLGHDAPAFCNEYR
jgi:hypothetical protein